MLRSLRESPCRLENGRYVLDIDKSNRMVECLKELEIDVLVVIGGDGTLQATRLFHQFVQDKFSLGILRFPKTIDDDMRTRSTFEGIETSLCLGFPTAATKIASITEDSRTTAIRTFHAVCRSTSPHGLCAEGRVTVCVRLETR